MSDSDESGVTHTEVSSPFEDLSDIGSPRADDHEFLKLPYMPEDPYLEAALQAPPSPDYVPGPEEPEQAPLSPDYVPGPEHADDEIQSEEDDDEDPEEDPIDYPTDGGDDGNDEMDIDEDDDMDIDADEEDEDDEMDVEVDEEAEEEHSASAYPVVVARLLGYIFPPESHYLQSSHHPQIPFPLSPPSPVLTAPPPSPIRSLGYRAATIWMRAEAAATSHSLPLPHPSYSPLLYQLHHHPMPASAPTSYHHWFYEVGESSTAVAARPAGDSWDEIVKTLQGAPVSTDTELGAHVRDFESMVRRDTYEIYTINILLMETEARMSREAWVRSMDASDLARAKVMSLRTTVHAQMSEITELQSADRNRRRAISDLLETDRGRREEMRELRSSDHTRHQQIIQTLTGQVTTLQGQQGPTGGPTQPELPEEAGSST
ncbi:hypothetical protein Tco_1078878 [Tanacetum coccineum]|uniref:Uncharacterized protein n=1 Tax=Tanacetum coccineum TaxID=301880 RepID=A0ABQ5HQ90_9ASTR